MFAKASMYFGPLYSPVFMHPAYYTLRVYSSCVQAILVSYFPDTNWSTSVFQKTDNLGLEINDKPL
jgi:hypothetical protein